MLNRILAIILGSFFFVSTSQAQETDPVLFSINDTKVHLSEFKYIYNKSNGDKADYSEASLNDYLERYINFKLQVVKGKDMGLNDDPTVKREQKQYTSQLASTYLTEREITEKLVKEAYKRSTEDRAFSHILIACKQNASETEQRAALKRAEEVKAQLTAANFTTLAKQYSDDQYSKGNGGAMGYFTVLQLPYPLETALYQTAKGGVSEIVKTAYGYHILLITDVRPAYGTIKAAHILMRTKRNKTQAKAVIDSLYQELTNGASFETLAAKHSQDLSTKSRAGQLGWIGINSYEASFEQAIFALEKDNAYSEVLETSAGYHIVKRIQAMKTPAYQDVKTELTSKIKRDARYKLVEDALISRIKKEGNYRIDLLTKNALVAELKKDKNFMNYRWKPTNQQMSDSRVLFTVGTVKAEVREFISLAQRSHSERFAQMPKTVEAAVDRILAKLETQKCLAYEETQLATKYPEFKSLVREYEEGILLFEVKKKLIWNKASSDEENLKKFFEANRDKYQWKKRAKVSNYVVRSDDAKLLKKIRKKAKKKTAESVKAIFNKDADVVQTTTGIYEKGKNVEIDQIKKWKAGAMTKGYSKSGSSFFIKIEEIIPQANKTLDEARGYVVADYQDQLEKELVEELRKTYKLTVDKDVFKTLVK